MRELTKLEYFEIEGGHNDTEAEEFGRGLAKALKAVVFFIALRRAL